jgi:hypothetical protein
MFSTGAVHGFEKRLFRAQNKGKIGGKAWLWGHFGV